jgi:hypothetical protein
VNWGQALLWGFGATVVLTGVLTISQGLRWSRISIPFILGTIFTADRFKATLIGSGIHFLNGWVLALIYAAFFESIGSSGLIRGSVLGFVHGVFVLTVLIPLFPTFHPRMASESHGPMLNRGLQPPGFMALNYGRHTPLTTLVAHVLYGMILGYFYHV